MTIREYLDKRRVRAYISLFGGFGIVGIAGVWAGCLPGFIVIIGIIFGVGGALYLNYGLRCPKCNGMIAYAVSWPIDKFIYISDSIKSCPFCEVKLDDQV
jgi:hypothetical protein